MRARRRLIWQLYPSFLLVILMSLLAVSWIAFSSIKDFYHDQIAEELRQKAQLTAALVKDHLKPDDRTYLDQLCKEVAGDFRISVILPTGIVICDSEKKLKDMDNHRDRPEIQSALKGKLGRSTRFSYTLQTDMMYVARKLKHDSDTVVVRTSTSLKNISDALRSIYRKIAIGGLLVALLATIICLLIVRRINAPLQDLKLGAGRFAKGDLSYRMPIPPTEEIAALAKAMNRMAEQLDERIHTITQQQQELEAVFSGMVEAVLVLDNEKRVQRLNLTAEKLLKVETSTIENRFIAEICRNSELIQFVERTMDSENSVEEEITFLDDDDDRNLSAYGAPLLNATGERTGALLVLHDITRMTRLEKVRKDFVANVSHELKTPITSIKGFVETLLDETREEEKHTRHFLNIILNHAERLDAIINDLLSLSRIEQSSGHRTSPLEDAGILEIIETAIQVCSMAANTGKIPVDIDCEDTLTARVYPLLLEQALINLIDNAVKYSEPGERVTVRAVKDSNTLHLEVNDKGCGIPREDLPRIFERFYRVDKARSRKLGGTGLGLAIVKHIAQVHSGEVKVESSLGKGSTFSIQLPLGIENKHS